VSARTASDVVNGVVSAISPGIWRISYTIAKVSANFSLSILV